MNSPGFLGWAGIYLPVCTTSSLPAGGSDMALLRSKRWVHQVRRAEKHIGRLILDIGAEQGVGLVVVLERSGDDGRFCTSFRMGTDTGVDVDAVRVGVVDRLRAGELPLIRAITTGSDPDAVVVVEWSVITKAAASAGFGWTVKVSWRGHFLDRSVRNFTETLYSTTPDEARDLAVKMLGLGGLGSVVAGQLADQAVTDAYASTMLHPADGGWPQLVSVRIYDNAPWWAHFMATARSGRVRKDGN